MRRPPSSPVAVAGLVSGVAGIVVLVLSAGVSFTLSVVLGAISILCWQLARRRMAAGTPGRPGQVKAVLYVGVAVLVLSVIAMVTWAVLSGNGITPEDLRDALERERARLSR